MLHIGRGAIAPAMCIALGAAMLPWAPDGNVLRWGILQVAALAACFVLLRARLDHIDAAAVAFAGWCVVSSLWNPDRFAAWDASSKVLAVGVVFLALRRLPESQLRWLPLALVAGVGGYTIWAAGQGQGVWAALGNPGFFAEFALIAFPLFLGVGPQWIVTLPLIGVLAATPSLLPLAVGGLAVVGWLAFVWRQRPLLLSVVISTALAVATFGVLGSTEAMIAIGTRLDLWAGTVAAWADAPLFGHGLGSFVYVFPTFGDAGAYFGLIPHSVEAATYPNAAHNDLLQLLMETGLVGAGLGALLVFLLCRQSGPWQARLALGVAGALALVGFPLQSPATLALVLAAAAHLSAVPSSAPCVAHGRGVRFRRAALAIAGVLTLVAIVQTPAKYLAQAHLSAASKYYEAKIFEQRPAPVAAFARANEAYNLDPSNVRARFAVFVTAVEVLDRFPQYTTREGVEAAWRVARSASPDSTLLLLVRLHLLTAQGECGATGAACAAVADRLVATASRTSEVRRLVRLYGVNA